MTVSTDKDGTTITVSIVGRLDTMTAPALEEKLNSDVTNEIKEVVFDLGKMEYMSSAGIRVIMGMDNAMQELGGHVKLIHVEPEVLEILEITGLVDLLDINHV